MDTIGEKLQMARHESGWTLDDVCKRTKIPVSVLESIEKNDFRKLPAPTYAIGFIRNYAKLLGLNDKDIVAEFIQQDKEASDTHLDLRDDIVAYEQRMKSRRYITVLVIVVVLGFGGYSLFNAYRSHRADKGKEKEKATEKKEAKSEVSLIGRYQRMMIDKKAPEHVPLTEASLEIVKEVFVSVYDGEKLLFNGILKEGTKESWRSEGTLLFKVSSPDSARLFIKDVDRGMLSQDHTIPYTFSITGETINVSIAESHSDE